MSAKETNYIEYIKGKYPQLQMSDIKYNLTDGEHSDIVVINNRYVFKFAKYDWSVGFLDNEAYIIGLAKKHLFMPLPRVEILEKGISKCNYIQGGPLFRNTLLLMDYKVQDTIAEQIGTFLKQLHSISLKDEGDGKISECPAFLSGEDWLSRYEEIQKKVFPYCDSYTKEYINQIFRPLHDDEDFLQYQPVLIHGDLMPYHFLFSNELKRINGIIDFGLSGSGDPAYDVGILIDNFGESFVKRISRYYKEIDSFIERARFYAYVSNVCWAKTVVDMLATRDFSNFRIYAKERDLMPIGSIW